MKPKNIVTSDKASTIARIRLILYALISGLSWNLYQRGESRDLGPPLIIFVVLSVALEISMIAAQMPATKRQLVDSVLTSGTYLAICLWVTNNLGWTQANDYLIIAFQLWLLGECLILQRHQRKSTSQASVADQPSEEAQDILLASSTKVKNEINSRATQ